MRFLNVEDAWGKSVALVVNLGDTHTVSEGRDVQHVEQGSLRSSDLASGVDKLQIGRDFDGTTSNLCWDTESLEERGLSGFHASVTSRDIDIGWSDGTSSGGSSDLVGEDLVTDNFEVTIGKNESDIALYVRKKALVLRGICDEAFNGTTNLKKSVSAPMAGAGIL